MCKSLVTNVWRNMNSCKSDFQKTAKLWETHGVKLVVTWTVEEVCACRLVLNNKKGRVISKKS